MHARQTSPSRLSNEVATQSGKPMAPFRLHDSSGRFCECKTPGRHVGNTFLQEGSEVLLFSTTAQSGLGRSPGCLWIYGETHVVKLRDMKFRWSHRRGKTALLVPGTLLGRRRGRQCRSCPALAGHPLWTTRHTPCDAPERKDVQ